MKFLVLGIGNAQADLIRMLSGDHVIHAVSYSSEGAGKEFVDTFEQIDIKDEQSVFKYAKLEGIDIIYSVGSDLGMVTAAIVSNKLKLPSFITPEIARVCHNKDLLRARLSTLDWNVKYRVLEGTSDMTEFSYPFILKPVDSQGQRGVFLIKNRRDFVEKFSTSLRYSKSKRLIVEEYIEGPEISINAYIVDGEICFSFISDRIVWSEFSGGIINKHRFPSQFMTEESKSRIHQLMVEVTDRIGIKNGPVYFQIKLKGNKEPKLIEVTPRLDGCHMWRLIKHATGVDLLATTIKHLMGGTGNRIVFNNINGTSNGSETWVLEFMCEKPEKEVNIDNYDTSNSLYHDWYYKNGEVVNSMNTFMEKCGYQIYKT
ncbi:carbamoyl-phosphate synthase small subunit [Aliifodinibius salipaludis]|uniref:Carbamoyl-phosphate synthase small subunit n=1 Tax=Fodinibius salipaludis TaxID=2032627 RepID=A0A2A2G7L2_9BACT|nr:ATP-grasp domain-containing protein [Aliifodinibius salipaludis]PAU92852.1 carbamoyl-phosphate synthase small subunit [Aliifodinibius salipaludis]